MSGARRTAMVAAASVVVLAMGPREAAAQPALTEPWPRGEEVSDIQQVGGTITAFMFGFGLGHAVEGRWSSEGWAYTLVDGLGMAGFLAASVGGIACEYDCRGLESVFFASMVVLTASRFVQIYDVSWGAREHNRRLYRQRERAGQQYSGRLKPAGGVTIAPLVAPTPQADGVVAGAALRF